MKASVQLIDPDSARMLLEGNIGNRPLSKATVARYAKEMKEGRWQPNGQSFSIFWDDKRCILLNGQHRLLALIEANVTLPFVVVEEDSADVFSTLDIGKTRATNVILGMAGFQNVNVLQSIARITINYERFADSKEPWERVGITAPEILAWVREHDGPVLLQAIHHYNQAHLRLSPTNTWYGGVAWLVATRSAHKDEWLRFHEAYSTGAGLDSGSPVLALRSYTINRSRLIGKFAQSAWDRQAHVAVGIRAWNDWLAGKETRYYKYQRNSLPMPKVV